MKPALKEKLQACIKIDELTIFELDGKINEHNIVKSAKDIEQLLIEHQAKPEKIQNVFELTIELMQNMLNYSYANIELENNKREAYGCYSVSYHYENDSYTLQSCNLITSAQVSAIKDKLAQLKGLDKKALSKLFREKMRSQESKHDKGAGLGFLMMARKCNSTFKAKFEYAEKGIEIFHLSFVI